MAMHCILVRGCIGQPGVTIEGLDKRDPCFMDIIDKLGFMIDFNGQMKAKPIAAAGIDVFNTQENRIQRSADGRIRLLKPYMYPTHVLNVMLNFDYTFVSTCSSGGCYTLWTLQKQC